MRSERFTLDTNILVYSVDRRAGARHTASIEIIRQAAMCDCLIGMQAISEFFWVATRKQLMPPAEAAAQAIDWLELFPSIPTTAEAIRVAIGIASTRRAAYLGCPADRIGVRSGMSDNPDGGHGARHVPGRSARAQPI